MTGGGYHTVDRGPDTAFGATPSFSPLERLLRTVESVGRPLERKNSTIVGGRATTGLTIGSGVFQPEHLNQKFIDEVKMAQRDSRNQTAMANSEELLAVVDNIE